MPKYLSGVKRFWYASIASTQNARVQCKDTSWMNPSEFMKCFQFGPSCAIQTDWFFSLCSQETPKRKHSCFIYTLLKMYMCWKKRNDTWPIIWCTFMKFEHASTVLVTAFLFYRTQQTALWTLGFLIRSTSTSVGRLSEDVRERMLSSTSHVVTSSRSPTSHTFWR